MLLARTYSIALAGVQGHVVEIEADIENGLVALLLVGLPDTALREARDRIRSAIVNSNQPWPQRRITVGLSPASLPKCGSGFDVATQVPRLTRRASASRAAAGRAIGHGPARPGRAGRRPNPGRPGLRAASARLGRHCRLHQPRAPGPGLPDVTVPPVPAVAGAGQCWARPRLRVCYGVIAMATGKLPTLIALPAVLVAVLIGVTVPDTGIRDVGGLAVRGDRDVLGILPDLDRRAGRVGGRADRGHGAPIPSCRRWRRRRSCRSG